MNGRRRDRGEIDSHAIYLLGFLCVIAFAGYLALLDINTQVKRIADAVCVEAPAAVPAEEVPDGE